MKHNYGIAIPSYMRPNELMDKTLSYLSRTNVDMKRVGVFVADFGEHYIYKEALKKRFPKVNIVVGVHKLPAQRNFIRQSFNSGQHIVYMDDDVESLQTLNKQQNKLVEVTDLVSLFAEAESYCRKLHVGMWGVSAVPNHFFMKSSKHVSFNLKFVVGAFYGEIIDKDKFLDQTLSFKGDYERSIKYYMKYSALLRFNRIAVKTKFYKNKGGLASVRNEKSEGAEADYLLKKYPQYVSVNTKRKSNFKQILIKDGTGN